MRHLFRGLIAATLALSTFACSAAEAPKFEEGKQYKRVREATQPVDAKRIEVAEFFWYGCPHCYSFEPTLHAWEKKKPADVDLVRYPNSLGHPIGILHGKAYYTAQSLNLFDKLHATLFEVIHDNPREMNSEQALALLFKSKAGVSEDVFSGTFNSIVVDVQVNNAELKARGYGVTSTPTLVIGGKYMTGPAMAGGAEQTVAVINFLVDKVRKERGNKK